MIIVICSFKIIMLSTEDYQDTLHKLNNIPASITGKQRQNLRQTLRKKVHEHELASQYPVFEPPNYQQFFVNYRTTEDTLIHLIETIDKSQTFTLDTESVGIHNKPNKPALIQLQVVLSNSSSYIIFIEVCHLPNATTTTFLLIRQLFEALFKPENNIHVWGEIDELESFVRYHLFTSDEIYKSTNINVQKDFKRFWNENFPHAPSTTNDEKCRCEGCLGIQTNNPWSLQDAIGYGMSQWLDKRITRSPFDIGLDPNMQRLNEKQSDYRRVMSQYAANDCAAIYQLLLNIYHSDESAKPSPRASEIEREQSIDTPAPSVNSSIEAPSIHRSAEARQDEMYELISSDDDEPCERQKTPSTDLRELLVDVNKRGSLTDAEKKKMNNRRCTVNQRKRAYKHEIIHRNIDRRFPVRQIKEILRQLKICFAAINVTTSSITRKTSLYIGIKNAEMLPQYEAITANLFTREHFDQIKRRTQSTRHHR